MHENKIRFLIVTFLSVCMTFGAIAPVVYAYNVEPSKELEEAEKKESEEAAAKGAIKAEEEAKARQDQEAEKVAQERAAREAAEKEAAEKTAAEGERTANIGEKPACIVPNLKRESLAKARVILRRRNCGLGKVTWSRRGEHRRSGQVVIGQQYRSGVQLPAGSLVGVTVGSASKKRK